ncbi:MAG: hypothetical protein ACRDK7_00785 [Solirubrobacteraceae bacterium]
MTPRGFSTRLHLTLGLGLLIVGIALVVCAPSAVAATPAPAWRIESVSNPTAFTANDIGAGEPVDKYELLVTNVGGAPVGEEAVTVTDTLPAGVTTSSRPAGDNNGFWECSSSTVAGHTVVTCTISAELIATLQSYGYLAGRALAQLPALSVYVEVEPGVPANTTAGNSVKVEGGGVPTGAEVEDPTLVNPSTPLTFGLADFASYLADVAGAPDTQAAAHPNSLTTSFDVTSIAKLAGIEGSSEPSFPAEDVRDVVVDLPAGFVGDPQAAPQCSLHDLVATSQSSGCPAATQVGRISFDGRGAYQAEYFEEGRQNIPVYNMGPEHGYPAEFGFLFADKPVTMDASVVGNGAATHVRATVAGVPAAAVLGFQGAELTFFGDPTVQDGLPTAPVAFFTNPSDCSGEPLVTSIHVDSYEEPGRRNPDGTPDFSDTAWKQDTASTPALEGCETLHFNPTISLTPDLAQAGAPTGLGVNLEVPQNTDPSIPATPDIKQVVVKLPAGMALSPSAANGLGACSLAQIGLENNDTPTCPESSKIATVEVETPLLPPHTLTGSVYLAQQGNAGPAQGSNPFGSLLAIYVVVEGSGVVVKLPGKVEANPSTGQLTTAFAEDPQLPFSDFKLHFKGGPGAPLSNPPTCGTYTPEATLSAWSGQTVQSNRSFEIAQGENGAPCPGSGFAPSFTAGTSNNQAAGFTPFSLTFSRNDGVQDLGGVQVTMPPGLLGKIAGIPQCPEAQANGGTCGSESLLGEATTAVGPGADPYWVKGGKVYLTGPYNDGPFGLSIVVPTTAGPFTLTGNAGFGKEVVRSSIRINPTTAQVTVVSDPLPSILEGIPLQIRTVNVTVNRTDFMFNPTNCSASSVTGTIASASGASAGVSSPFEAANCAALPFTPSLAASTSGKTSKADGASLKVNLASAGLGQASIAKVDLTIPKILPARLTTLQKACTEAQFNANPAGCPTASDIATAIVHTPILANPLTGPAYFVSHGGAAFPDVEIVLQGEGVMLVLDGHTQIKNGVTYSRFETVPDAPFTTFEFNAPEGPYSIFTANGNLCARKIAIPTTIIGQNGAQIKRNTPITVTGCNAVTIAKRKLHRRSVVLAFRLIAKGVVTVRGSGLKRYRKTLGAGSHQIKIGLSKKGRAERRHHKKIKIKVALRSGATRASATTRLKL